jgi:nitrogen fixation/metabolism regulation signal transduction histidine kinase
MTPARLSVAVRRLWPRRMRTRLAVFYALLFLVAGVVLLALSYTLLASVLLPPASPPTKALTPQDQALLGLCKPLPTSAALLAKCNHLIDIVGGGAKSRGDTLAALRKASAIGLVVLTIAAAGLGWLVAGRALRPVRSLTEAARRASELRLGQRIALTGPDDELKELGELGPAAQEPIDLATVAEDALDATHTAIDQRRIKVEAALESARARGDRVLLERMIANLIENGVRHNNAGGWIGIRTIQQDDSALFEIANTGADVPAEQIPSLFEPFARAKQRLNHSDGVGLGLSITSAIARAHNATITARPRLGGGLEISVTIPTGAELTVS